MTLRKWDGAAASWEGMHPVLIKRANRRSGHVVDLLGSHCGNILLSVLSMAEPRKWKRAIDCIATFERRKHPQPGCHWPPPYVMAQHLLKCGRLTPTDRSWQWAIGTGLTSRWANESAERHSHSAQDFWESLAAPVPVLFRGPEAIQCRVSRAFGSA
jgi:hypothetical protein